MKPASCSRAAAGTATRASISCGTASPGTSRARSRSENSGHSASNAAEAPCSANLWRTRLAVDLRSESLDSSAAPSHHAVKRSRPTPAHDAASAAFARSHEPSWLRSALARLVGVVAEFCSRGRGQVAMLVRAPNAGAGAHPTRARRRRRVGNHRALQLPRHDDVRDASAKRGSGARNADRGAQRSRHLRRAHEQSPQGPLCGRVRTAGGAGAGGARRPPRHALARAAPPRTHAAHGPCRTTHPATPRRPGLLRRVRTATPS